MFKKLERNDPCWCGSGRKYKKCHEAFDEKIRKIQEEGHIVPGHELIKTCLLYTSPITRCWNVCQKRLQCRDNLPQMRRMSFAHRCR